MQHRALTVSYQKERWYGTKISLYTIYIFTSIQPCFLERYDTYFYFNIVYNNSWTKHVFLKKAQPTVRKGDLRVSVLYSFISFFYLSFYLSFISIIISVCSFFTHRVQFFHTPSEIFSRYNCSFCTQGWKNCTPNMQ